MSYQIEHKNRGGRTKIILTHGQIKNAINITMSMRQAANYLNVS